MAIIFENSAHLLMMLLLLLCSAFFSGSETAFFNLTKRESLSLKNSHNKFANLAFTILSRPKRLLTSLLFTNMLVNILYFALSGSISVEVAKQSSTIEGIVTGGVFFSALLLFGEMLPKSIAFSISKQISIFAAFPCYIIQKACSPVIAVLNFIIIDPIIKLTMPNKHKPKKVKLKHIKMLLELSHKTGSITSDQNHLISEVLEFSFLKVRHIMRPRVDMVTCNIHTTTEKAIEIMYKNHIRNIPVYEHEIDNIVGIVTLRNALINPDQTLHKLKEDVVFVPEQKKIESMLEYFRANNENLAIVVDEYGGISGLITMYDIISELLGSKLQQSGDKSIIELSETKYRLAGNIPLHEWADALGLEIAEGPWSTLGGYIISMLGKVPQENDNVQIGNLSFTVETVDKYRVKSLILETDKNQQ